MSTEKRKLSIHDVWLLFMNLFTMKLVVMDLLSNIRSSYLYTSKDLSCIAKEIGIDNILRKLFRFKNIDGFEALGEWANEWYRKISSGNFSLDALRILDFDLDMTISSIINMLSKYEIFLPKLEILDPEKVRKGVHGLLSIDEIDWLTKLELEGINEACRALIFDCPTAAEMLLARVGESVLRRIYQSVIGKPVERKTWGAILDELEEYYKGKWPTVLSLIEYLKDERNRLMHPEKMPTKKEAEETLILIIRVIKEARRHFKKQK